MTDSINAQESKRWLDYQYLQTDGKYLAYTAFSSSEKGFINLELTYSKNLQGIKEVTIYDKKYKTRVEIERGKDIKVSDDDSMTTTILRLDLEKLELEKYDCKSVIKFKTVNNLIFELPLFKCILYDLLADKIRP